MACPFRRSSSHVLQNGAVKKGMPIRQSSFQVQAADDEHEATLNLKQLSSAILILTAPPVSSGINLNIYYYFKKSSFWNAFCTFRTTLLSLAETVVIIFKICFGTDL